MLSKAWTTAHVWPRLFMLGAVLFGMGLQPGFLFKTSQFQQPWKYIPPRRALQASERTRLFGQKLCQFSLHPQNRERLLAYVTAMKKMIGRASTWSANDEQISNSLLANLELHVSTSNLSQGVTFAPGAELAQLCLKRPWTLGLLGFALRY